MRYRIYLILLIKLFWSLPSLGQKNVYNFHHLSVKDGLHDGIVKCLGQDKYGYIWIGTVGGLNRFDGKKITQFTYAFSDTLSPYSSQPNSIFSDRRGRLWIGFPDGLTQFDFKKNGFSKIKSLSNMGIGKIIDTNDSTLFISTNRGLVRYNTNTDVSYFFSDTTHIDYQAILKNNFNDLLKINDNLYLITAATLLKYNLLSKKTETIPLPKELIGDLRRIVQDAKGNFWLGTQGVSRIYKLSPDFKTLKAYDEYLNSSYQTQSYNVRNFLIDNTRKIWVVTGIDGLLEYDEFTDKFHKYLHDEELPSSPSGNNYRSIFQDNNGIIWLGGDFNGVSYFKPEKNIFESILPYQNNVHIRQRKVGRGFAQDKNGNYWMGTHDGLSRLNPKTGTYTYWRNETNKPNVLYHNVVRSLLCDDENNIWIGTGAGVNKYNSTKQKMEFIDSTHLPYSFYNSITKDRSGNIWFGTNDSCGLYWYNTLDKTFHNISVHPVLKKYHRFSSVSYVMEDSKNRIWISFAYKGLLLYNKLTGSTKYYERNEKDKPGILGTQVIDIKEDKTGVIWLTSFNGINGIDVEHDKIYSFNRQNGLIGNMVSPLVIDSSNRVWLGATGGLMMLNEARNKFTLFTENDGISSVEFPEHAAVELGNGNVVFPSNNGFIKFNPLNYVEQKTSFPFYVRSYSIFDKEYNTLKESDSLPKLQFKPNENSFAFNLVAINYLNPNQTWFAYKLEGFEREWHYTQDPKAVYTNVSGGDYTFVYKATSNNADWEMVNAKTIAVIVERPFYKHPLFLTLVFTLFFYFIFLIYKYRISKQKEVFKLKEKAQLLEKEKALVMYEGLKQHLNPHFLFNSLTSLNSLITIDPTTASEFLDSLSKTYRYILKSNEFESVALEEEIKFAENYVKLQKTRFDKGFDVRFNIPTEMSHFKIVPVTLQNLIENAIKHNIIDEESPLIVEIFIEDNYIVVRNNLQRKNFVETSNKQGLMNIQSLYKYLSDRALIIIEDEEFFTVKLPLL